MRLCTWVAFAALTMVSFGCGNDGKPSTVPVTGKVMVNKTTPPVGALVVFHPTERALGKAMGGSPFGKVADDGSFQLTTYESGDGAPEGEYGVTVDWRPEVKGAKAKITLGDSPETGRSALKGKYSNPNQPVLKASVKRGEANHFTFEVD